MRRVTLKLPGVLLKLRCNLIDCIGFDDIAGFHVIEILDAQTTFISLLHFTHIVLETPQRSELPLPQTEL